MWFWGFVCDYQRDLRETLWFRLVQYNLSTLACYFPADSADHAEEYSKLYYFAEKDRLFEVKAVLSFWGLSAIICEICGRHWGLVCVDCLSTLACYFPADCADHAEEYNKLYYFAEKDRLFEVKAVLGF